MWHSIFQITFNYKFSKYFFELKYKFIYMIFSWFFATCCSYIYIHPILYLFSNYLLEHMQSNKFFFSDLIDILYIYLKLSIYISFLICLPFFILNFFFFFFNGVLKHELIFFFKLFLLFNLNYVFYFVNFLKFILPQFINTFLIFEKQNNYYTLFFEAKFEEYFLTIFWICIYFLFLFQIPLFCYYLIFLKILDVNFFFNYKSQGYIFLFFINSFLNPLDFLFQIYFLILIFFFLEIFIFFFLFFTKIFWKMPYEKTNTSS